MALTLEQILAANDRAPTKVTIPQWGGDVYMVAPPGDVLDAYDQWKVENPTLPDHRAKLVAMCLCDEAGERLNPTLAQVAKLSGKNGAILDYLAGVAWGLMRFAPEQQKELEGN